MVDLWSQFGAFGNKQEELYAPDMLLTVDILRSRANIMERCTNIIFETVDQYPINIKVIEQIHSLFKI